MAKENYKDHLAGAFSQFITTATPAVENPADTETAPLEQPKRKTKNAVPAKEKAKRQERAKHNAKYINYIPATYRAATDEEEPRGRRVHLLFRPSTHAELLAIAHSQGRSLNNLVEEILTEYLNGVNDR